MASWRCTRDAASHSAENATTNDGRKTFMKLEFGVSTNVIRGLIWNGLLAANTHGEVFSSPEGAFTLEESWMHAGRAARATEVLPLSFSSRC